MKKRGSPIVEAVASTFVLRIVAITSIIYLVYYLWWRVTATLNPEAPVSSWLLVLAEAFGACSYILFAWMTRDVRPTHPHHAPPAGLTVDVFIPTLNESLDILEATILGCQKIIYPHQTWVLDDGCRDAVRRLALELGCKYLTRPSHEHAKAGNINHALMHTSGEFIVMLDADMIPQPNLLDRTLGYFEDPKLAVIQMPQEFYNWNSIQHDRRAGVWHEQSLFFRVIQPGKNHSNSAFWCGSPSILRRRALEETGGIATSTVTEDIHTSVRLHSRGWSTLFVNEPLAYGIAPQTLHSFLVQRLRWAQGTMQLYRGSESPLWIKGLTFGQRMSYLASFLAYFESFQKLVLLLTPVFIVAFDIFPMKVGMFDFLVRWLPYFAITVAANTLAGRGHFRFFKTEEYNLLKMLVFMQAAVTLIQRKRVPFAVTPKSVDETVYRKERAAVRSLVVVLGIISGAVLFGLLKVRAWDGLTIDRQLYLVALGWASYNGAVILLAISDVLSKDHDRRVYRFYFDLEAALFHRGTTSAGTPIMVRNLSTSGIGWFAAEALPADVGPLTILFETAAQEKVLLEVTQIRHSEADGNGRWLVGGSISPKSNLDRRRLFEYLFIDVPAGRIRPRRRQSAERPGSAVTRLTWEGLETSVSRAQPDQAGNLERELAGTEADSRVDTA